ncbi:triphosphoribosyl-dephospho-CoA synthase, partial [Xanthomonas arboricola]|uniref:triphosphoribosyl-dephospho-CoA synthase n=1 Tax=Xanthomonas arboricola TaxID=56448 RepID=UPI003CCF0BDE
NASRQTCTALQTASPLGACPCTPRKRATGGINTHRGAIFSLGLLTAQAARLRGVHGHAPSGEAVCSAVQVWRDAL